MSAEDRTDIRALSREELKSFVTESLGEKAFRADQIYSWLHEKYAASFDEMSNLSKDLRKKLADRCELVTLKPVKVYVSKIDGTRKYLMQLPDGNIIESVLMRYDYGNTACVSCQVGCAMGCKFCASAIGGLTRDLRTSEILEEVYAMMRESGERISHIVMMGCGEPLQNLDQVIPFIELISSEGGYHLSKRNITVSTCGIVPGIKRLAEEEPQVTLALSLHAPTQEKRRELMPIANKYDLEEVLNACREHQQKTGRRLTYEYCLVSGVNDNNEEARELIALLDRYPAHLNLIPVNPVKERDYTRSDRKDILNFKKLLEKNGINVTIRREIGADIDGACGQLRKGYLESAEGSEQAEQS
ncbi:MAG: 23S rRNA (adenine(2503)-C(2))-methyltransferase RlmN [Lachnospiraceae bacterium]|nr:23S rRNA (adenine(2503)-C(2))-methyltransferase RlmN [Lachnospiraceae bacterium]